LDELLPTVTVEVSGGITPFKDIAFRKDEKEVLLPVLELLSTLSF
jgi:hypothetical protein